MRRYGSILIYDAYVMEVMGGPGPVLLSGVTYKFGVFGHSGIQITARPADSQFDQLIGYPAPVGACCTMAFDKSTGTATVWGLLERPKLKECAGSPPALASRAVPLSGEQIAALLREVA